jgi:ABC-type transport system substrate-binding protein
VELVKAGDGKVDLVTELSPLETLRVAQSASATVVKNRGSLLTVIGQLNMRKTGSPWLDARVRRAANHAIARADLIEYGAKGNGVIVPALISAQGFGHDPSLAPYPSDPVKARDLLRQAGHPDGLAITLIAQEDLETLATVVGKMLEQAGFKVQSRILDPVAYTKATLVSGLDPPSEKQTWDIALTSYLDPLNFPGYLIYYQYLLDGSFDWAVEQPALRQLYQQMLRTVDSDKQRAIFQQMERHVRDEAYVLFLYNPVQLYAVNKGVQFVPYVAGLNFVDSSVTDQHWSVRKGAEKK